MLEIVPINPTSLGQKEMEQSHLHTTYFRFLVDSLTCRWFFDIVTY